MIESLSGLLLLVHLAATLFMVGVIWFVQIVHYPLFAKVDRDAFAAYEQRHTALTAYVVGPPMLVEAVTALLLFWFHPGTASWSLWTGGVLLVVIWCSTVFVQIPCHQRLTQNFDFVVHRRLVLTNWFRTVAWSLRGLIVLGIVWNRGP